MIENQQVYITYTADGVQREWEFPYQYVKPEDISLYIEHDGVLTQIASQLYAFSEVTKKVTYPLDEEEAPVPQGDSVLLWRETNITQEEDSSITNFKSNDLERMTDKLTMICQELSDKYNRAVHFEPTDVYDTDATTYVKTITDAKDTAVQAASDAHDEAVAAAGYASDASGSAVLANNYKNAASASADESKKWAEGTDEEITPLGGEHSAKEWSNVAKYYAETIGAALVYNGSVSTYSNLPSSGQKIGDFWNVLDTGKNYAWTGTEWDDISGIMDLSAYRTAAAQDIIDGGKQATLVSGTNIKTVNSNSLLGSGNIDIDALPSQTGQSGKFLTTDGTNASWAPAAAEIDNKSITQNSSNQIQTVGVIDQNNTSNAIKTWTGTKDEFDDIVTKDAHTLYTTTDETDSSTSYTTTEISAMGMPSGRYEALTLGSSGDSYTAPGNGYYYIYIPAGSSGNNQLIYIENAGKPCVSTTAPGILTGIACTLPVLAGDSVKIYYVRQGSSSALRFYYADGNPGGN